MNKAILAVLAAAVLAGCGGGSSSGTADVGKLYTGKTTPAVVDASNATAVSSDALSNIQQSAGVGSLASFKSATDTNSATNSSPTISVISIVTNIVKANSNKKTAKTVASTINETVYGSATGGSGSYNISGTETATSGSGTITFNSYVASPGAPTISGAMSMSGSNGPGVDDWRATVNMTNITVAASTLTVTMNGTISIVGTASKETVTASIVTLDSITKKTSYMKDLTMELTSGSSLTISGTFYNNDYGYVVISTTTPLVTSGFDSSISSGELLFTGANGTKAKAVFPGPVVSWYNGTSFVLVP